MDNAKYALSVLCHVWGNPNVISAHDDKWLESLANSDTETRLETCLRVAGITVSVTPFDYATIRRLAAQREIELAK